MPNNGSEGRGDGRPVSSPSMLDGALKQVSVISHILEDCSLQGRSGTVPRTC